MNRDGDGKKTTTPDDGKKTETETIVDEVGKKNNLKKIRWRIFFALKGTKATPKQHQSNTKATPKQ